MLVSKKNPYDAKNTMNLDMTFQQLI
jgi:hypothetical protein